MSTQEIVAEMNAVCTDPSSQAIGDGALLKKLGPLLLALLQKFLGL